MASARWEHNDDPQGALSLDNNRFALTNLSLLLGDNHIRVIACDSAGNESSADVAVKWEPETPPAAPSDFKLVALSTNLVALSWVDNATNENGFSIERAMDQNGAPATWAQIATMMSNTSTFYDPNTELDSSYWYRVQAYNRGGRSDYSSLRTPVTMKPPVIAAQPLSATASTETSATFSVEVSNPLLVSYQWWHGQTALTASTQSALVLTNVSANDSGDYLVVLSNPLGSVTSQVAKLTVNCSLVIESNPGGAVSKSPEAGAYGSGSLVELTANAQDGYQFTGWLGDLAGTNNPITITMDANKRITAVFTPAWILDLTAEAGGTVSRGPDLPRYLDKMTVQLTASSDATHVFSGWSGSVTSSNNPLSIVMDTNKAIVARFLPTYVLKITTTENGTVNVVPKQDRYASGTIVQLIATPAKGFGFANWGGDCNSTAATTTLRIDGNKTVTASFRDAEAPSISISIPENGSTPYPQIILSGSITDNVGLLCPWLEYKGLGIDFELINGQFAVSNLNLSLGENHLQVHATDLAGNESSAEVVVTWTPSAPKFALLTPSILSGKPGNLLTLDVTLTNLPTSITSAMFTLNYPTNALRLLSPESHNTGNIVPFDSIVEWTWPPIKPTTQPSSAKYHFWLPVLLPGKEVTARLQI